MAPPTVVALLLAACAVAQSSSPSPSPSPSQSPSAFASPSSSPPPDGNASCLLALGPASFPTTDGCNSEAEYTTLRTGDCTSTTWEADAPACAETLNGTLRVVYWSDDDSKRSTSDRMEVRVDSVLVATLYNDMCSPLCTKDIAWLMGSSVEVESMSSTDEYHLHMGVQAIEWIDAPAPPTPAPTSPPTHAPTAEPTPAPTMPPTMPPTGVPTVEPTPAPTAPTSAPTSLPTGEPTAEPTPAPTAPTSAPTAQPTPAPTKEPCPLADFSQDNLAGVQSHDVLGTLVPGGYVFSWLNGMFRKMVFVDWHGMTLQAGYVPSSSSAWMEPSTWTDNAGFYMVSNVRLCDPEACTTTDGSGLSDVYPCICGNTTCARGGLICDEDSNESACAAPPTAAPTPEPSPEPTPAPTPAPTLVPTPEPTASCPYGYWQLGNIGDDVPAWGLSDPDNNASSIEDCAAQCDANPACGAFEWRFAYSDCAVNHWSDAVQSAQTGTWPGSITCAKPTTTLTTTASTSTTATTTAHTVTMSTATTSATVTSTVSSTGVTTTVTGTSATMTKTSTSTATTSGTNTTSATATTTGTATGTTTAHTTTATASTATTSGTATATITASTATTSGTSTATTTPHTVTSATSTTATATSVTTVVGVCPATHPYAYHNNNAYCCRTNMENTFESDGAACDGSALHAGGVQSRCCENHEWAQCSYPPCSDFECSVSIGPASFPTTDGCSHVAEYTTLRTGDCRSTTWEADVPACAQMLSGILRVTYQSDESDERDTSDRMEVRVDGVLVGTLYNDMCLPTPCTKDIVWSMGSDASNVTVESISSKDVGHLHMQLTAMEWVWAPLPLPTQPPTPSPTQPPTASPTQSPTPSPTHSPTPSPNLSHALVEQCSDCCECGLDEGLQTLGGGGHSSDECHSACLADQNCTHVARSQDGYCHWFSSCEGEGNCAVSWTVWQKKVPQYVFASADGCPEGYSRLQSYSVCSQGLEISGVFYTWGTGPACSTHQWPSSGCFAFTNQHVYFSDCGSSRPDSHHGHTGICVLEETLTEAPTPEPTPEPTPACQWTWAIHAPTFSLHYADGVGTTYALEDAQAECISLGSSCAAVTCRGHSATPCTLRASSALTLSTTGEVTYLKVCVVPSLSPSPSPSASPSSSPSPSTSPSSTPSRSPSTGPSSPPTQSPSLPPSQSPSLPTSPRPSPSPSPSASPSSSPSASPSPSLRSPSPPPSPSAGPSSSPSASPSPSLRSPSPHPSPSASPSASPSPRPSPSSSPSSSPSHSPSSQEALTATPTPSPTADSAPACDVTWTTHNGMYSDGYADGVTTAFAREDAQTECVSMGTVCAAVTCLGTSCTVRASAVLAASPAGEVTHVKACAASPTVVVRATVQGVDYDLLAGSPEAYEAFEAGMKETFADLAGPSVSPEQVDILVTQGSVVVTAEISVHEAVAGEGQLVAAERIQRTVQSANVSESIVESIHLAAASNAALQVAVQTEQLQATFQVTVVTAAPTAAPTPEPTPAPGAAPTLAPSAAPTAAPIVDASPTASTTAEDIAGNVDPNVEPVEPSSDLSSAAIGGILSGNAAAVALALAVAAAMA